MEREKAVVLLSGGLDSTTVLALAQSEGFECHCLTFKYGQRHSVEVARATEIAAEGGVPGAALLGAGEDPRIGAWTGPLPHVVIEFDLRVFGGSALTSDRPVAKDRSLDEMSASVPDTYVPARNSVFLAFAASMAESIGASTVFIGVNALDYSGYPDCRPEFIVAMTEALNLGTHGGHGGLDVRAPLITLSKAEIIALGLQLGVDYAVTHSCYDPGVDGHACGRCDSCLLRAKGFEANGMADPALAAA